MRWVLSSVHYQPRVMHRSCAVGVELCTLPTQSNVSIMRKAAQALTTSSRDPCYASSRPRFLPHLHANHHRNLGLRSQPLHFASTAPFPSLHLSRAKCRGLPQPPPFVSHHLLFSGKAIVRMCRQTYQILQCLELNSHTLLGFSSLDRHF